MAFLVGGANSAVSGYDIENSLRSDGSTTELTRTPGSETNRETFTFSCWHKSMSSTSFFSCESDSNTKCVLFNHGSSQGMRTWNTVSGSTATDIRDAAYYRDPSSWYHSVWAIDTTDGTEANRVKMYVNGQAITVRSGYDNYPSLNEEMGINQAAVHTVGARTFSGETDYLDGYLAEVHFVDGQQLTPSSFGETDEDSGIWKPKEYTGSYGTNGFFLEFKETGTSQNSSGMGADTSGNDNHYAVTNFTAVDQCTDTPTNNFATLRIARDPAVSGAVLSEGNLKFVTGTSGSGRALGRSVYGTIPVNKGKWYFETKILIANIFVGVAPDEGANVAASTTSNPRFVAYYPIGNGTIGQMYTKLQTTETQPTYGDQSSANDVLGFAVDMDNKLMYVRNSGGWADDSGNWDEANPNESTSINFDNDDTHLPGYVCPWMASSGGATSSSVQWNFGSPPFTISSGNADANGYGNFEYAVPSGYYAMCTKNLAKYG